MISKQIYVWASSTHIRGIAITYSITSTHLHSSLTELWREAIGWVCGVCVWVVVDTVGHKELFVPSPPHSEPLQIQPCCKGLFRVTSRSSRPSAKERRIQRCLGLPGSTCGGSSIGRRLDRCLDLMSPGSSDEGALNIIIGGPEEHFHQADKLASFSEGLFVLRQLCHCKEKLFDWWE